MNKFKDMESEVQTDERRIDKLARTRFNNDIQEAIRFAVKNYTPNMLSHIFGELKTPREVKTAHDALVEQFNKKYPGGWEVMRAENYFSSHFSFPRNEIKQMKKNPEKSKLLKDLFVLLTTNAGLVLAGVLNSKNPAVATTAIAALGVVDTFTVGSFTQKLLASFKFNKLLRIYKSKEYKQQLENISQEDISRMDQIAEAIHYSETLNGTDKLVERGKI